MKIDENDDNLKKLVDALSHEIELVEFKSSGAGSFVHANERADLKGRGVEVSYLRDGKVWAEFWEASDDEHSSPAKENTFDDMTQAEIIVRAWLLRNSD